MPLSLGSEECRKPRFQSGSKIVRECMRLRQANDNLGGSMIAEAKDSNQQKPRDPHTGAQGTSSYIPIRMATLLS